MNKKKLLSGVSSAFIAAAAISLSSAAVQAADVVYGDANCDGSLTIADATAIIISNDGVTLQVVQGDVEDVVVETPVEQATQPAQMTEQINVNSGEIWKCTQKLNTPDGYSGGAVRLELIQEVNGELKATVVTEGTVLTFPYKLDITGISGVSTGTLYCSELIDGVYQELGHYPIEFKKAE